MPSSTSPSCERSRFLLRQFASAPLSSAAQRANRSAARLNARAFRGIKGCLPASRVPSIYSTMPLLSGVMRRSRHRTATDECGAGEIPVPPCAEEQSGTAPSEIGAGSDRGFKIIMWTLLLRSPRPDAAYWPGRRWLALLDAVAWTMSWAVLVSGAPFDTGVVGVLIVSLSALIAVRRFRIALFRNERYRFTIRRWGLVLAVITTIGITTKLMG